MDYKDQHFIPQGYLKAWCDPTTPEGQEPYVWRFTKDGAEARRKPPKKVFFEKDLYTIHAADGRRDLRLEHGLSELESRFGEVRRKIFDGQPLDDADRLVLVAFVAAMHIRTPSQIGHVRGQWKNVLDRMNEMQRTIDESPEKARTYSGIPGSGPSLGIEDVERLVHHTVEHTLEHTINGMAPILFEMDVGLMVTDDPIGFITCDAPVVFFYPAAHLRPWHMRGPGLGWRTIEVTFPVSPRHLVLFNRQGITARLPVPISLLDELNRRTRLHAREHFVVTSNEKRDAWFTVQEPPTADSPTR